jgi:hypothetical protein
VRARCRVVGCVPHPHRLVTDHEHANPRVMQQHQVPAWVPVVTILKYSATAYRTRYVCGVSSMVNLRDSQDS